MRAAVKKTALEAPAVLATQTRAFIAPLRVDFAEDVTPPKAPKEQPFLVAEWSEKKASTEHVMKLLQAYKDVGDANEEPFLKFHNPKTFEDFEKPIPNFRAMSLKAGEVPKLFDTVLSRRAEESVEKKQQWWAERKQVAEEHASKAKSSFPTVPVPEWKYGNTVALDSLKQVTDSYYQALQPKRKLRLPTLPATVSQPLASFAKDLKLDGAVSDLQASLLKAVAEKAVVEEGGKTLDKSQFLSKREARKIVYERRAQVHSRWLKMWAKKLLISPEVAVVPLKEVDYQLASKFESMSTKFADLMHQVSLGKKTFAESMSEHIEMDYFLLRRDKNKLSENYPTTEAELEGTELAKKLEDPQYAMEKLLGPLLKVLGSPDELPSEQVKQQTAHKYTPERYMYKEGMKLAARYAAQEKALKDELKAVYGPDVDIKPFLHTPRDHVQILFDKLKETEKVVAELAAEKEKHKDDPYMVYALTKQEQLLKDPSNIPFDDILYPEVTKELVDIELSELAEVEAMIDEAEEEELWLLTLTQQIKHVNQHFRNGLPHAVLGYMDPLFFQKVDQETTFGDYDSIDMDMDLCSDPAAVKEQWGLNNLSHHFLPLIRYRRQKHRKLFGKFAPELFDAPKPFTHSAHH